MLGNACWRLAFALRVGLFNTGVEKVDGDISGCCTLPPASRLLRVVPLLGHNRLGLQ